MAVAVFDSSAFVKLLVEEPGSDLAARLWDQADVVTTSRLAGPEVSAALAAARRGARLDVASETQARQAWAGFWSATRIIELTPSLAMSAADLASRFVLGGADAVHLASALILADADPILVAWDLRLRSAALQAGVNVAPSET